MQLNNSIQQEKISAREIAIKLASEKSPNLDEMEVFYPDEDKKTGLYFKRGTSDEFIKQRIAAYYRRNNISIIEDKFEESIIETRKSRYSSDTFTDY